MKLRRIGNTGNRLMSYLLPLAILSVPSSRVATAQESKRGETAAGPTSSDAGVQTRVPHLAPPDWRSLRYEPPWRRALQEQKKGQEPQAEEEEEVIQVEQEAEQPRGSGGKIAAFLAAIGGVAGTVLAILSKQKESQGAATVVPPPPEPRLILRPEAPTIVPPRWP